MVSLPSGIAMLSLVDATTIATIADAIGIVMTMTMNVTAMENINR
jgi:hypothetical protein